MENAQNAGVVEPDDAVERDGDGAAVEFLVLPPPEPNGGGKKTVTPHRARLTPAERLLSVATIFYEPAVLGYERGREIFARFPRAERVAVEVHQNIPNLYGNPGAARDWIKNKRTILVLGVRKTQTVRPNTRSSDFIAPGQANGCSMACSYCVPAGTLITTPQGQVPVEQIRDGVQVLAFDSSSGRLEAARVSGTACREANEVLEIQLGDTTLRVTPEHPLMTRRGWVKAADLTEDDEVLCDDGRTA